VLRTELGPNIPAQQISKSNTCHLFASPPQNGGVAALVVKDRSMFPILL
jgi:hypothetical protein